MNEKDYNFTCDLCGRYCGTGDDTPSIVAMTANYGSAEHDGEPIFLGGFYKSFATGCL